MPTCPYHFTHTHTCTHPSAPPSKGPKAAKHPPPKDISLTPLCTAQRKAIMRTGLSLQNRGGRGQAQEDVGQRKPDCLGSHWATRLLSWVSRANQLTC